MVSLDEAGRDDPDDTLVPVLAPQDVRVTASLCLGPLLDLRDRRAQDPVLDCLPVPVQLLEPVGKPAGLLGVLGQE